MVGPAEGTAERNAKGVRDMGDQDTIGPDEAFKMKNAPGPDEAAAKRAIPDDNDTEAHRFHGTAVPDDAGPDDAAAKRAIPDDAGPDEAAKKHK